ncbi:MAG: FISUMP domain-containing protein [Melioribacteraceae bacterium]
MKPKSINIYLQTLAILLLAYTLTFATNTNPVVSNVAFNISGTTVTVTYDVADADDVNQTFTIQMEVSNDGGTTYGYNYGATTGDIGAGITTGTSKTITWQYSGNNTDIFKIKIIANDLVVDGGPCAEPTITYAGKVYNTVQIGTQCWLKENLNVGTMINSTTGGTNSNGEQTDNGTIEKYCYNNNTPTTNPTNCDTYGGLYQWAEAVQYENGVNNSGNTNPALTGNVQGICPSGWHIPTQAEYQTLKTAVSNSSNALKAVGQGTGNNSSGFSALLAGTRNNVNGSFISKSITTYFWSSTENGGHANYLSLSSNNDTVYLYNLNKRYGFSVRCLKD